MMVPFRIPADGEWNHAVKFYGNLARLEERHLRQIVSSLRTDITHKVEAVKAVGAPQVLQIADPALVVPLRQLFESKFVWLPGEYESVVSIDVEGQPSAVNRFRFTLYESDTADLRAHTEDYTFGGGVYFGGENRTSVWATVVRQ